MRNFGYLLLLVFFFNIKSLHHFIIFLRNWNSGFNSGSGSFLFSHETLQFRKKNSVKNYIHSSLVLDQKLSDKGILRLYCLSHACHSKMSVFRCLSDLSVQIVRRSTLNRLEVHFRVQGSYRTSSNSKSSVMSLTNSVTILPILYFPRQDWVEGWGGGLFKKSVWYGGILKKKCFFKKYPLSF